MKNWFTFKAVPFALTLSFRVMSRACCFLSFVKLISAIYTANDTKFTFDMMKNIK